MKLSIFNNYKIVDQEIIIFNSLTRAIVKINENDMKDVKNVILRKKYNEITHSSKSIELLSENGIIVDDDINEVLFYKYWYNKQRYSKKSLIITYVTTYKCNCKCSYCFEGNSSIGDDCNEIKDINNKIENLIIEYIKQEEIKYIDFNFFGGEPLLEIDSIKNLCTILYNIKKLYKINYNINVVTNGLLLDNKILSELKDYGVNSLQITLDGDKITHDKRRVLKNGKGTFDKIYKNLIQAHSNGFDICLNINYDRTIIQSIINLLEKIPNSIRDSIFIKLSPLKITPQNINCVERFDSIEMAELFREIHNKANRLGYNKKGMEHSDYGPCLFNRELSLIIDPYGNLSKCLYGIGDKNFVFGNLSESITNQITANKAQMIDINEIKLDEKCFKCSVLPLCNGGCRREVIQNNENDNALNCKKEAIIKGLVETIFDYNLK